MKIERNKINKMNEQAYAGHGVWSQTWEGAFLVLPPSSSSGTLFELQVPPLENVCDVIPASWDVGRRR